MPLWSGQGKRCLLLHCATGLTVVSALASSDIGIGAGVPRTSEVRAPATLLPIVGINEIIYLFIYLFIYLWFTSICRRF
jgi:hypothetical protein